MKMKKFLSMLMIMMLMFGISVLSACSDDSAVAEDVPEETTEEEEIVGDDIEGEYDSDDDGNADILNTEVFPNDSPHFYLIRDGEYYSLDNTFYSWNTVGMEVYQEEVNQHILYSGFYEFNDGSTGFYSYNEVPVPRLKEEDRVIAQYQREEPELRLYKIQQHGHSIALGYYPKSKEMSLYHSYGEYVSGATDIQVRDYDGNIYEDYYDLDKDNMYIVSWYKGADYWECGSLTPEGKSYVFSDGFDYDSPDYTIKGEKAENGALEYNFADIPSGLYRIGSDMGSKFRGVIRI